MFHWVIGLILLNPNVRALSISNCDGVMHLEDHTYLFNSPDYPNRYYINLPISETQSLKTFFVVFQMIL